MLVSDVTESLLASETNTDGGQNESTALYVNNLSYIPSRTLSDVISQKIVNNFPTWDFPLWERLTTDYMRPLLTPSASKLSSVSLINSVTFTARAGKITALLSPDYGERRTIIDLIVGRRKRGVFSGEVALCGGSTLKNNTSLAMNSAFIPRKTLFIPGLTYIQLVKYSARLRMPITTNREYIKVADNDIDVRVMDILKLLDLWKCRHDVLPDELPDRGPIAGQLRRLSIAMEIITLPPLIILDDPVYGLEPAVGLTIMQSLKRVSERGHIVVIAMPLPSPQILALINHLVVISSGYTIYSSPPQDLRSYFCSPSIGYELKKGVELMTFVHDIASGVERPKDHRGAVDPIIMQENFETSPFFADDVGRPARPSTLLTSKLASLEGGGKDKNENEKTLSRENPMFRTVRYDNTVSMTSTAGTGYVNAFNPILFKYWGYSDVNSIRVYLHQLVVITQRAIHAKLLEKDSLRRAFGSSILVGLFVGYLMYGLGTYGKYTMTILNFPYVNTSNITAMMFFLGAFVFTQQVMTVQIICTKVRLFRQEQASGYCGIGTFAIASLLSESPVAVGAAWTFGYIIYFMASLNYGWDNFLFYSWNIASIAIIGLQTAFLYAVLLRKEILVRDMYLLTVFSQVLLSGFPFQLPQITRYFSNISSVVPLRWSFEGLMAWKFGQNYYDGNAYITPFGFSNFEWYHSLGYYHTFMFLTFIATLFFLLSKPNLMRNYDEDRIYKIGIGNIVNSNRVMYWCYEFFTCFGIFKSHNNHANHSKERASSLDPAERSVWMTDEDARMHSFDSDSERRGDKIGSRSGSLTEAVGVGGNQHHNNNQLHINNGKSRQASGSGHSSKALTASQNAAKAGLDNPAFHRIRTAELSRPLLYTRESSVTGGAQGNSRLSIALSADGTQTQFDHGPTVAFQHITYKTRDRSALSGYACVLDNVSGQFDWGKLSCILGAPECGKSTLLHVLAGDTGHRSTVTGQLTYDGLMPDINLPLWRRCALVRADDQQFPSLTVQETINYAMELRCLSREGLSIVEENVKRTMDIVQLTDIADKQICKLTAGERRRVSIAEEIVHGPALLLIDEPTTNLDSLAESILLGVFREMVNESRTVVCTMHQPSSQVFELFDTLLLLSKGQVIYHGPTNAAVNYFIQKPYSFPYKEYNNPADYLTDISGGFLEEGGGKGSFSGGSFSGGVTHVPSTNTAFSGNKMNGFTLGKNWRKSDEYIAIMKRMTPEKNHSGNNGNGSFQRDRYSGRPSTGGSNRNSSTMSGGVTVHNPTQQQKRASINILTRTDTDETQSTDGGDEYALSERGQSDADGMSDDGSGRLTFSRASNSYGGTGKTGTALMAASQGLDSHKSTVDANGNVTSVGVVSMGIGATGGSRISKSDRGGGFGMSHGTTYSDADDIFTKEQEQKQLYELHAQSGIVREFTDTVCGMFCFCAMNTIDGIYSFVTDRQSRQLRFIKMSVLLRRSALALWKRRSLFWGNIVITISIALILGWVMGNSGNSIYNSLSFFAVGTLLLMLSNVQFISYLFSTHQVFYKDHSRGMYSNFSYWLVASLPLYLLRAFASLCYGLIIYDMLGLVTPVNGPTPTFVDTRGYFLLVTMVTSVASTMMVELIIYVVNSIRDAYLLVPAISFLQFQFSGLFLKPILLPTWMKAWAPSISLIRWTLQGSFLNQFQGSVLFPNLPIYNVFSGFCSLYGWGGKTKWYCFNMVIFFLLMFRMLTLIGTAIVSQLRKGGRGGSRGNRDVESVSRHRSKTTRPR